MFAQAQQPAVRALFAVRSTFTRVDSRTGLCSGVLGRAAGIPLQLGRADGLRELGAACISRCASNKEHWKCACSSQC